MVSPQELLSAIEEALLGPSPPTPSQRIELLHALRSSVPTLKSFLSYPGPKASDRAQVQSREVRLPNSPPIPLDDTDVQLALKLSDDLNLNEIECVRLLVGANEKWVLFGREPSEIYRFAAGLWYMERRYLITSLCTLLRAVLFDQWTDADLLSDIEKHLDDIFNSGLQQRLIMLIKELNREEATGFGGPSAERYVADARGTTIERRAVVSGERLSISHCLVLSAIFRRMTPKDLKDVFSTLKDCAAEANSGTTNLQIAISLLFDLVITLISDALRTAPDKPSGLSNDSSFRQEFNDLVIAPVNDPNVEPFVDCVRFAWTVHLMTVQDRTSRDPLPKDLGNTYPGLLEYVCSSNVFKFFLSGIVQTAAYQNDDEDMIYTYNTYFHKLMMCFLSHPLFKVKVKEMKEKAMSALSPYLSSEPAGLGDTLSHKQVGMANYQPFISLLELISQIYQKEPELLYGNEELWMFIHFAGEDHTNIHTVVAFLRLLSTLASTEEGASKVYELLQGKRFRSIGWSTLFDCLSIYDDMFKQALQTSANQLPDFQEGDAQALVAYLSVLQKVDVMCDVLAPYVRVIIFDHLANSLEVAPIVRHKLSDVVENGNPIERMGWFPDIEPLFKLLGYENVPPYLKGALRNAIAAFIKVSPAMKETIWNLLEQYDLPVVVGPSGTSNGQPLPSQVYDMQFELNEVEARREKYPSTLSFINLLNSLIAEERDASDRGRRFLGIFRFVYDHVFGPFPQRAYIDPTEKWQLVVACLQHFLMVLKMYDVKDGAADIAIGMSQSSGVATTSPPDSQIPALELLKDFMSGKIAYQNILSIISSGVDFIICERTSQMYGQLFEKAVELSLEILVLVMEKDVYLADFWQPLYQPLEIILSKDHNHIVPLLEYVRYDLQPKIQQCSIKIMSTLSSRMVGLVPLLLRSNAAKCLIEDYATCLQSRFEECQSIENTSDDSGVLILQLLIDNISRPAPNVSHLLLRYDTDSPVERSILQPKVHYSCLKVILDNLEKISRPDSNALLHEFGFQLLYGLCMDPLTSGPTMDLLSMKKYHFFSKHLETICTTPLPKRSHNQSLRISMLHQRAWLLKLLALELHIADMAESTHREACLSILSLSFGQIAGDSHKTPDLSITYEGDAANLVHSTARKNKVLELLDAVQFRTPNIATQYPQLLPALKLDDQVSDMLKNPETSEMGGVYYYSERGDRLLDLDALHEKLWQIINQVNPLTSEAEKSELRGSIQQFLRWAWRYNKNLEEQAAQLHMLTGWSQTVEVAISKRMPLLEDRTQILFELLGASLSASASPDCTLRMAVILSNVALTCMAKLRDERFLCPGGVDSDSVTCLDIISVKQLSNSACHSILYKLMMAIMRTESSEILRRRQYALLLSYFQYCRSIFMPDVPASVLRYMLHDDNNEDDELNLQKISKEQAQLESANFSIIKKEAQALIDLVMKDAVQGSEVGKALSFYVLDSFISIDHDKFFLNQLQSRSILRSCIMEISNFSCKDSWCSLESVQRLCTLEAQLSLLLRVSYNYEKHGAQILLSMSALEYLGSSRAVLLQGKGNSRWIGRVAGRDPIVEVDKQRLLVIPMLRLVSSLTSLVESSDYLEVKNKIVREVLDFVKGHQSIFYHIMREDVSDVDELTLERINLVVSILSKVWPYEENDEYGIVQELFSMMCTLFRPDFASTRFVKPVDPLENQKNLDFLTVQLCFSVCFYLNSLMKKKMIRLPVMDSFGDLSEPGAHQLPSLDLLLNLLNSVTAAIERAGEEKFLLLNKIQDINELSRQEVDEIISLCMKQDYISSSDNIRKRRYIAMIEMSRMAGNKDQLITLLLQLAELILNVFLHLLDDKSALQDLSSLTGKLHPILERLEQLKEDKIGHDLKLFKRSVCLMKDMLIRSIEL